MTLGVLSTLEEQLQLLSCADKLHTDARQSSPRVKSLERQVAGHPARSASARSYMLRVEESVEFTQRPVADDQSALLAVGGEHDEYPVTLVSRGSGVVFWRRGFTLS